MSANQEPQVAKALQDISNSVSSIVSEEIALAKAEVSAKAVSLGRGAGIGAAAGVFLFFALIMAAHTLAWGIFSSPAATTSGSVTCSRPSSSSCSPQAQGLIVIAVNSSRAPAGTPMPTMAIAEAQATKQAIADARKNA